MNLAYTYPIIYWNTACLMTDSGGGINNGEEEYELSDSKSTDYTKVATAIGKMTQAGIKVSAPDINYSDLTFTPDENSNTITFGLKGMLNVGDDVIKTIIENRPYNSVEEFLHKVSPNKQAMISLIKGGAFDSFGERKLIMAKYLWTVCDKKKKLTLQNMASLIKNDVLPESLNHQRGVFEFTRYLKDNCKSGLDYKLDERALNYLIKNYDDKIDVSSGVISQKSWDKIYQVEMDKVRNWIRDNHDEALYQLNKLIFKSEWEKYALGNYSAWEMEVLCFYYHEHELKNVNRSRYGISDFSQLKEEPIVDKTFRRGGANIPIYRLNKIIGTCIAKNKTRSSISLLTTSGIVEVKFRNEFFSLYDKRISERGNDGVKHVIEDSWFSRGTKLMIMGYRKGDNFVPKKYSATPGNTLSKIEKVDSNGNIVVRSMRAKGDEVEDD